MKNSATTFLKHILFLLSSATKSKSMAIKSKAEAIKARVIMLSLLKNKRLPLQMSSISHKIHALLLGPAHAPAAGHEDVSNKDVDHDDDPATRADVEQQQLLLLYKNEQQPSSASYYTYQGISGEDDDDDKYPDLRHCLFEEEDDDPASSVIDMVKNSKEQEGQDFKLEDEIDHVADLFIMKFHKRIRLQKLQSFKRYQEMLERSA